MIDYEVLSASLHQWRVQRGLEVEASASVSAVPIAPVAEYFPPIPAPRPTTRRTMMIGAAQVTPVDVPAVAAYDGETMLGPVATSIGPAPTWNAAEPTTMERSSTEGVAELDILEDPGDLPSPEDEAHGEGISILDPDATVIGDPYKS